MADDGHLIEEEKVKTQADIVVAHTRPQAPAHTMTTKTTRDASIWTTSFVDGLAFTTEIRPHTGTPQR